MAKAVSAAAVGLALVVSPAWRGQESMYDNHTPTTVNASKDTPRAIRVSRNASMRTKVIRYASGKYDLPNTKAFVEIIWRESRFDPFATNKDSGAYGLGQALPADKMASAGSDWRTNPYTQLNWVVKYIDERYGSPMNALLHHNRKGWY